MRGKLCLHAIKPNVGGGIALLILNLSSSWDE